MRPDEVLKLILSIDNHNAWLGGWEIIRSNQDTLKSEYLPYLEDIRLAVSMLPKPERPSLSDSREIPKLALLILDKLSSGECRCSVYPSTHKLLPESEEKYGFIEIRSKKDIPWEPEFSCLCNKCGKMFSVKENHGYHYPVASWEQSNA